jgi:hypothetical protein
MEAQPKAIQTYETLEGKIPVEDWLNSLRDREGKADTNFDRTLPNPLY